MAVVASGISGGTHLGDLLPFIDLGAHVDQEFAVVAVVSLIAVSVVDDDEIAVAAHPAGIGHGAAVGGFDGLPAGTGDVDALVVGGADAAGGPAPAEGGSQPSAGGPGEGTGSHGLGPLFGAHGHHPGHRLGDGDGGEHIAAGFRAVQAGDIGGDIGHAVHACGEHAAFALIHGTVVHPFGFIGHGGLIFHALHALHAQKRHGGADGQFLIEPDLVDVKAGIQRQQFAGGHIVAGCDLGPGVAGLHSVDHFLLGCGVQRVLHRGKTALLIGADDFAADGNGGSEFHGNGVFRAVFAEFGLQRVFQRAFAAAGHGLAVDFQHISVIDDIVGVTDFVHQSLFADQRVVGDDHGAGGKRFVFKIVIVAQGFAGAGADESAGLLEYVRIGHSPHISAVDAYAGGELMVLGETDAAEHSQRHRQIQGGVGTVFLEKAAQGGGALFAVIAPQAGDKAGGRGDGAARKQRGFYNQIVRLGYCAAGKRGGFHLFCHR